MAILKDRVQLIRRALFVEGTSEERKKINLAFAENYFKSKENEFRKRFKIIFPKNFKMDDAKVLNDSQTNEDNRIKRKRKHINDYYPQVKKIKTNGSYKEAKLIENKTTKCESKVIMSEIDAKDNNSKIEGEVNVTSN